jgi:hypothetical protein
MAEARVGAAAAQDPCYLVELDAATPEEEVRRHLGELSRRLGSGARIDLRWPGDLGSGLPGVRVLSRASGARALASAAARAAADGGHLVVLLGPVLPERAAIDRLTAALELDPLVGTAQPRFADPAGRVWSLPDDLGGDPRPLASEIVASLPEHYLTTERLAACLVVRRDVAAWFAASPDAGDELLDALAGELCLARRRGHRNLVMNRVVVTSAEPPRALYPAPGVRGRREVEERFPDARQAAEWFRDESHQRFEEVAAGVSPGRPDARAILIDCRGAMDHHNGTSQAIFGLLDGLVAEEPRWDVDLLFGAEGAEYHGVARRYPAMRLLTRLPDASYAAAVRLDQPWTLSTVAELHRRSTAIAFNMLDTIAWDVVYVAPPDVRRTWRFVSEHADGLLYISEFTRERFRFRFGVAPGIAEEVIHLSLDADEHRGPCPPAPAPADHLLVFGNRYEHKAVGATADVLNRAFPYRPIRALGAPPEAQRHNVTALESGRLGEAEIDRLVATARVVIFPSYYEGFGLPAVKALAYGRTVVVRASPLWRELAGLTRMPGQLVEFVAPHELVEVVGKALAGEPIRALPLGGALGAAAPPRWRDCARRMVSLVERIAAAPDARRWCARDRALELAGA